MALTPGTCLGLYEIAAQIGEGGMGEVYRARDTKLDRDVALKILPEAFTNDPERLARFQREAKVLASLNHPNIAAIYGLEDRGETHALVLELVEGFTLADRISQGAIPLDEALPIAKQIAEALEAAHEQGIIHRDLKPANIKVTPDGVVKVLDFGLAKALDASVVGRDFSPADLAESPTMSMTAAATRAGFILGTAAYMSPEQAKGRPVDKRTDIWAFGVVLYEMLTGHQAFGGTDISETLAAVLRQELDWTQLPPETSTSLRRLLRRCVVRDRRQRLADVSDARLEIEEALHPGDTSSSQGLAPSTRTLGQVARLVSAGVLLVGLGAGAVWAFLGTWAAVPAPIMRLSIPLPEGQRLTDPNARQVAISPDGSHIVYAANSRLYVRALAESESVELEGTQFGTWPFISPDGEWIGYLRNRQIFKIPVGGGPPVAVAPTDFFFGASWGSDDTIVFADVHGLFTVPRGGGAPELILSSEEGAFLSAPEFLPDGETVLYTESADSLRTFALSLETGKRTLLVEGGGAPRFVSTGHLLYRPVDGDIIYAVPFDPRTLEVGEPAVPVLEDVYLSVYSPAAQYDVSPAGHLVKAPITEGELTGRTLSWVSRTGQSEPLAFGPADYSFPSLSPDETQIAVSVRNAGTFTDDIWLLDVEHGNRTRLTFEGDNSPVVWSPDGTTLAFASSPGGASVTNRNIFVKPADGLGNAAQLTDLEMGQFPQDWSDDGHLLFSALSVRPGGSGLDIWTVDAAGGGDPRALVTGPGGPTRPALSPDGRWLAYSSSESGQDEVYVRPFPDVNAGRFQVSSGGGGDSPLWIRGGAELVYRGQGRMMQVTVDTTSGFRYSTPTPLFDDVFVNEAGGRSYDVTADGQRFLMIEESERPSAQRDRIDIIVNWFEELKELVPH